MATNETVQTLDPILEVNFTFITVVKLLVYYDDIQTASTTISNLLNSSNQLSFDESQNVSIVVAYSFNTCCICSNVRESKSRNQNYTFRDLYFEWEDQGQKECYIFIKLQDCYIRKQLKWENILLNITAWYIDFMHCA